MATREESELAEEFVGAQLGDWRRNARLVRLAESVAKKPDSSFPKAMTSAELEAAYRFFGNVKVKPALILEPHVRQTQARMADEVVTLVAHDTTTVSFKSDARDGLAGLGETRQFLAHCSLALRADGSRQPLGVLAMSHYLPVSTPDRRLQNRWADQMRHIYGLGIDAASVVHLMDREADDYSVLDLLKGLNGRFVIRVQYDRKLEKGSLRESLMQAQLHAEREVFLSRRANKGGPKSKRVHPARDERNAQLSVSARQVDLPRPYTSKQARAETLRINVVRVWEPHPPNGQKAVEWMLYTSEPIDTPEQVMTVVDWYRARWTIEEYFKALKTGCALEARQLGDLHALVNALALLVPIAWQLLLLKTNARRRPNAPANVIFEPDELQVLRVAVVDRCQLPDNPTVLDAMLSIASLGGHLKHNGPPGWQTLAHGYQTLRSIMLGWNLRYAVEAGIIEPCRDQ